MTRVINSTTSFRPLERATRVTPMGVRFRDAVAGAFVNDGLVVTGYPVGRPGRRKRAILNGAGVYVLAGLSGLRASESGVGDDAFWAAPPAIGDFTIEVLDALGRFVPFRFDVRLPCRGLVEVDGVPDALAGAGASGTAGASSTASPPGDGLPSVPLFSSPARVVPPGTGVVRAEVYDLASGRPAADAVVALRVAGGAPAWGVADDLGRVAVLFPYPEPQQFSITSPGGAPSRSVWDRTWSATAEVRYSPAAAGAPPAGALPDLAALFRQKPAVLWGQLSPQVPLGAVTVAFGREALIATAGGSMLFVSPGS